MVYYNEIDPKAAAWLRELIDGGHIARGDVDERSIADVRPGDLDGYTQCHFFAGIGGWSRALRLAGVSDEFPVWTGSCPCQPFSSAGKGRGKKDPRHLFPVWQPLIADCRPPVIFGEQVASKAGRHWLAGVCAALEALGYGTPAADLCAASVGSPHIRQRLWWLAYAPGSPGAEQWAQPRRSAWWGPAAPDTAERGGSGGLEDTQSHRWDAGHVLYPDQQTGDTWPGDGSSLGGMAHTDHARQEQAGGGNDGGGRKKFGFGCDGRLGDSHRGGQPFSVQSDGLEAEDPAHWSSRGTDLDRPNADFWARFDIVPCRDGKARRIESGTFPLADGIPGRVGLLRGYGNAIVPQVAAIFIRAALESVMTLRAAHSTLN